MVSCRKKNPQAVWGTSKTRPHSEAIYRSTNDETDFSVRFLSLAPKKVSEGGFVALEWPRKIPDRVVAYDLSAKTTLRRKEVAGRTRLDSGPLFLKRFRPGYPHRDPLAAIRKRLIRSANVQDQERKIAGPRKMRGLVHLSDVCPCSHLWVLSSLRTDNKKCEQKSRSQLGRPRCVDKPA